MAADRTDADAATLHKRPRRAESAMSMESGRRLAHLDVAGAKRRNRGKVPLGRNGQWATSTVLGTEGIYDARGALRRCGSRWNIGAFGIGGHPQGYSLRPVYAAGHARAVIDMVHREFRQGDNAIPSAAPQPLEAALWLGQERQRTWACAMAQRLQTAAEPAEAELWNAWREDITQIEREGSRATRRWNRGRESTA